MIEKSKIYLPQLTFLRFLAATIIVIFHYGNKTSPFNSSLLSPLINQGSRAVSFFFFLSGVVLYLSYFNKEKIKLWDFYKRRIARIYPIYLLAFIITLALIMFNHSFPKGISIILQLFGLHAWYPGINLEINYPSWSISVEVFFYLLFPFILSIFNKLSTLKISIITILIWALSIIQNHHLEVHRYASTDFINDEIILHFPLWHLNAFIFGMLCGKCIINYKKNNSNTFWLYRFSYLIGIIALLVILYTENNIKPHAHNGLLSPLYFLIIWGLSLDISLLTKTLSNSKLVLLGNASYAMYIFQFPVYLVYSYLSKTKELNNYHFFIYFIVLVFVSILIHKQVENKVRTRILKPD